MEGLYIVFLIDSKFKEHDGQVFRSLSDAREFCHGVILEHWADKIVIGMFVYEPNIRDMYISTIQTIGFKNDVKEAEQMKLFKPLQP